jgi:hypothetical protein
MPTIPFGKDRISRLIVGGNQQNGASHNHLKSIGSHMVEYFTVDRTVEFVRKCRLHGIDTWQANYSEKTGQVVRKLRESSEDINLISLGSPAIDDFGAQRVRIMTQNIEKNFDLTLTLRPKGIYLFGWSADILYRQGKLDTARDFLKKIRQTGVQVGVCAHMPEVIEYVEEKGWDVDFYMASLYQWAKTPAEILKVLPEIPHDGYSGWELYLPSEYNRMLDTIRKTKKTCLAFKVLAGGRTCSTPEQVEKVFRDVLTRIKPDDAIVVGMYPRFYDEIAENAGLVKKYG